MKPHQKMAIAALVTLLALATGACSGRDEGSAKKGTGDNTEATAEATGSPSDNSTSGNPTSDPASRTDAELSDADFTAKIDKIHDSIKAAGSDPCKLADAQTSEPPEPRNPTQVASVVKVYAQLLRSMAGTLPDTATTSAKSLETAADEVERAAKDANYSPELLRSNGLVDVLGKTGVSEGISAFASATKDCAGAADLSGSDTSPKK